jgi:integrase
MYRQDEIDAATLLSLRAVRPPAGASARPPVVPYTRTQVAALRDAFATRWPRLDAEDAERRVARLREKGTGYRKLRSHAIRLQLEAVISLALDCGLRRHEIFNLCVEDAHYDNAYVVVWKAGRWESDARAVPFTERSRTALHDWIEFRASLRPDHAGLWLNLWAEATNREPLKRSTFDKLLATYVGTGWTLTRLRSTCAVRWVRAGLRPAELQNYLGVSSVADVLPYYSAAGADVERRIPVLAAHFDSSRD